MKAGRTPIALKDELIRQRETKIDYRSSTQMIDMTDGRLKFSAGPAENALPITSTGQQQIATYTGIPFEYYKRMRENAPELLDHSVNTWMRQKDENRMVRTLDGNVRAFLSDRYLRIDNLEVFDAVLPILSEMQDADIVSCEVTPSRMYIKLVNPRIEQEVDVGDVVQAGIVISNSEIGLGSIRVEPLVYRLVCKNGAIASDYSQRKNHIWRGYDDNDPINDILSDETKQLDDMVFLRKVTETARAVVDMDVFSKIVDEIRRSKGMPINSSVARECVELTARKFIGIKEADRELILQRWNREEEYTVYGMGNAITRYSQQVSDYDHATELERIGMRVLTMTPDNYRDYERLSEEGPHTFATPKRPRSTRKLAMQ